MHDLMRELVRLAGNVVLVFGGLTAVAVGAWLLFVRGKKPAIDSKTKMTIPQFWSTQEYRINHSIREFGDGFAWALVLQELRMYETIDMQVIPADYKMICARRGFEPRHADVLRGGIIALGLGKYLS